jgi:hypothetical protein
MRTRPEKDPQQAAQCVCNIPCEWARSCIGETGRLLAMRLHEHGHNLKEGLPENSTLDQHAYVEGHRSIWNEDRILDIERNARTCIGNNKESDCMACLKNPISQPSLDISPIWIPPNIKEVTKSEGSP